jgi:hypothetical protein
LPIFLQNLLLLVIAMIDGVESILELFKPQFSLVEELAIGQVLQYHAIFYFLEIFQI